MLTQPEARHVALVTLDIIQEMPGNGALDLVLIDALATESPLAWLFPFNTREYVQTGAIGALAVGVGPIMVNRQTGVPYVAPPLPRAQLVAQYEAAGGAPYNWF